MQVLDVQQSSPTPYTPAGGTYNNNPVPGAGGLPSLSGLNNRMNPMAQQLQGQGRGEDSVLVHMTPDEVSGLQALAMHHGTSLTINPNTGLPEAGKLGEIFKKLLPALIGAGLAATGVGAPLAAGIVGIGQTALTGSLKKGLIAGLGAFGGASLAGAAGLGGSISNNAFGVLGNKAGVFGANMGLGAKTAVAPGVLGTAKTQAASNLLPGDEIAIRAAEAQAQTASNLMPGDMLAEQLASQTVPPPAANSPGFFKSFGQTASRGLPGIAGKVAPGLAAASVLGTVADVDRAIQQGGDGDDGPVDQNNFGLQPYRPIERRYNPRLTGLNGEGEIDFFEYINAPPGYMRAPDPMPIDSPRGFASGGSSYQPPARMMSADQAWATSGGDGQAAKPIDQRMSAYDYAADLEAYRAMTEGIRDAQGNTTGQFSPAGYRTVGTITTFNGKRLQLGEDMRWRTIGDALPVSTSTSTATPTPTPTPTPTTTGGGLAALPASEALRQINPDPNKLSNAYQQNKLGATLLADMPRYTEMYQTSPGKITASLQYPGGSFNDQIRAQINAREAARTTVVPDIPGPTPQPQGQGGPASSVNVPAPQPQTAQDYIADYYRKYGVMPSDKGDIPPGDKSYRMGGIHMDNGAFVVDARTVSELGNGSSNAGREYLRSLGGFPVNGPGDGVSDSIRANIGGVQEARVARDEVIFPAKAVKRMGGANKLYALMDKAHAARKKAGRGEDTKLRSRLSAL